MKGSNATSTVFSGGMENKEIQNINPTETKLKYFVSPKYLKGMGTKRNTGLDLDLKSTDKMVRQH